MRSSTASVTWTPQNGIPIHPIFNSVQENRAQRGVRKYREKIDQFLKNVLFQADGRERLGLGEKKPRAHLRGLHTFHPYIHIYILVVCLSTNGKRA